MPGVFSAQQSQQIEQVSQQGGFDPSASVANGIAQAANILVPAATDARKRELTEQINTDTKNLGEFLRLSKDPALLNSEFGVQAIENPVVRSTLAEFVRVRNAAEQGKLPQEFAQERLRTIQNSAIASAPEFEQEIRAAMINATGQDPQKQFYNQLLATAKQSLTPEQKAMEELRKEAFKLNMTVPEVQQIGAMKFQAEGITAQVNVRKGNGTLNLFDVQKDVAARSGVIMMDIMGQVRRLTKTGGMTPDNIVQMKGLINSTITSAMAQVQAGTDGVDGNQLGQAIIPLEKMQANLIGMVDDGSLLKLANDKNALTTSLIEGNILSSPIYGVAWALGGQQGFAHMVDWLSKSNNDAHKKLLGQISDKAGSAFKLNELGQGGVTGVVTQYGKMGTGERPVTQQESNDRAYAAGIALSTPNGSEDLYSTALKELRQLDEELAWTALGTRHVITGATKSPTIRAAVIQMQQVTTSGLANEYLAMTNDAGIDTRRFQFKDGKLTYTMDTQELGGVNAESVAEANAFVARFNRANTISGAHSATGTLASTRYSGTQDYWETVTSAGKEVLAGVKAPEETDKPAIVQWGRDENGKPIQIK